MASIGPRLQEARLKKGLTLERIADDTNIALRFLSKLEKDDFEGFPGEPYIVGFIRNYAEYLGLDAQALIDDYRGLEASPGNEETQEEAAANSSEDSADGGPQATDTEEVPAQGEAAIPRRAVAPSEGATPRKHPRPRKAERLGTPKKATRLPDQGSARPGRFATHYVGKLGIVFSLLIVAVAALWVVGGGFLSSSRKQEGTKALTEYRVEGSPFEKRLYVGDSLLVPLGEEVYKVSLVDIGEKVELETPFGKQSLGLGESGLLDPNSDGNAEATISIADFERRKPASGALVDLSLSEGIGEGAPGEVTVPETSPTAGAVAKSGTGAALADKIVVFRSSRGPYPFVVQISFRGSCLFRYEADRKDWVEKYYGKGETITVNASSALTIWSSNAQAAKLSFQASGGKSVDLELGAPGEIVVKRIAWDSSEGSWALVSSSLD